MQLLQLYTPVAVRKHSNLNMSLKPSSHYFEVREKISSDASLLVMNRVASGDSMATALSAHKLKDDMPPLMPCCEGKILQINEDLVRSGLSAISVKHEAVIQCLSMSNACEKMQVPPGLVKHRNSFRCLHRPDLKRVPYLRRLTPSELETLFRGYADVPHHRTTKSENLKSTAPTHVVIEANARSKEIANNEFGQLDGNGMPLHPIPETRPAAEDIPLGMRLHGARARLYTSVLAGTKTGDQLDNLSIEEYDVKIPEDAVAEDEIQINEELQIILPPRCDEIGAESSAVSSLAE